MPTIKEKLKAGQAVHGCWLNMGSSIAAEIFANAGFDWVLVDLEHGAGTEATLVPQLQAIGNGNATPLVRVESSDRARVQRVLDAGVHGVMFPQIRNAAEAREAISHMHYPPKGRRGLAKMVRAMQFGKNADEYLAFVETDLLGIIQIETRECLDHLDEIASIEGVDVLFIGPSDLSLALGVFGQWDHPLFVDALHATVEAAGKHGKTAGAWFLDPAQYDFFYQAGFRFLGCSSDLILLNQSATALAQQLIERGKKLP